MSHNILDVTAFQQHHSSLFYSVLKRRKNLASFGNICLNWYCLRFKGTISKFPKISKIESEKKISRNHAFLLL